MARGQKLERQNFERLWSGRSSSYLRAVPPLPSNPSRVQNFDVLVFDLLTTINFFDLLITIIFCNCLKPSWAY